MVSIARSSLNGFDNFLTKFVRFGSLNRPFYLYSISIEAFAPRCLIEFGVQY